MPTPPSIRGQGLGPGHFRQWGAAGRGRRGRPHPGPGPVDGLTDGGAPPGAEHHPRFQLHASNPHRDAEGKQGWLLAAGDAGGSIIVWDLATWLPISPRNGSAFNVYAVAFSPDGTTLASVGRINNTTILWDWAKARTLLIGPSSLSQFSGLAFSRDGTRLATGHHFLEDPDFLCIFVSDLDAGRGIQSLRGLTSPVELVLYSPDRRKSRPSRTTGGSPSGTAPRAGSKQS